MKSFQVLDCIIIKSEKQLEHEVVQKREQLKEENPNIEIHTMYISNNLYTKNNDEIGVIFYTGDAKITELSGWYIDFCEEDKRRTKDVENQNTHLLNIITSQQNIIDFLCQELIHFAEQGICNPAARVENATDLHGKLIEQYQHHDSYVKERAQDVLKKVSEMKKNTTYK